MSKKIISRFFFLLVLLIAVFAIPSCCNSENISSSNSIDSLSEKTQILTITFTSLDECIGEQYPISVDSGKSFVFPEATIENSDSTKFFCGWLSARDGILYKPGEVMIAVESETYLAKWETRTATLTFLPNMSTLSAEYGTIVALPSDVPEHYGYNFEGWEDDTGMCYPPSSKYIVTGDVSFTPKYAAKTVHITFIPNGGSGAIDSIVCSFGETITLPSSGFHKSKYHLGAWSDGTRIYDIGSSLTVNTEELVFSPVWETNTSITLNLNDHIKYESVYEIDLHQYLNVTELIKTGYSSFRVTLNLNITKTNGKCQPAFGIYSDHPVDQLLPTDKNRYTNAYLIAENKLSFGQNTYTSPISMFEGRGVFYLSLQARAASFIDVAKNEFAVIGTITIEFF